MVPIFKSGGRRHFNPRSREGSDKLVGDLDYTVLNFNPRSREGSDKLVGDLDYTVLNFNPRSREGSDKMYVPIC